MAKLELEGVGRGMVTKPRKDPDYWGRGGGSRGFLNYQPFSLV